MLFSSVAGPNPHPDISKMTIWIQIFQNNNPDMIRIFQKSGSGGQKKLRHTPDPQHWLNGSLVILKFITIMNQQQAVSYIALKFILTHSHCILNRGKYTLLYFELFLCSFQSALCWQTEELLQVIGLSLGDQTS